MFHKFFPELFDLGIICILNTPIVKVQHKKKNINFYSLDEFNMWKESNTGFTFKYYKGLGTSTSKEWKEYFDETSLDNNLMIVSNGIDNDVPGTFKLMFSKEKGMTNLRKDWMGISELE
jgi:DNA topoisomerase-2